MDPLGLPALDAFLDGLGLEFQQCTFDGHNDHWMENRLVDHDMYQEAAVDLDSDKLRAIAADLVTLADQISE